VKRGKGRGKLDRRLGVDPIELMAPWELPRCCVAALQKKAPNVL
jgi:hypothetical protein